MKNNQKGFSVVEILIVIVVVGLIGGAVWYVWQSKNKNIESVNTVQSKESQLMSCTTAFEGQKSWIVAYSYDNNFTMCVPDGWTLVSDTRSANFQVTPPYEVESGKKAIIKNKEIYGKDGTSDMLQVFKATASYQGWTSKDAERIEFTLNNGTKGIRYYTKHTNVGEGIGSVEGEEDYEYLFEKNGKFIHAVYTILPGTEKHLDTIEEVLKTLDIK